MTHRDRVLRRCINDVYIRKRLTRAQYTRVSLFYENMRGKTAVFEDFASFDGKLLLIFDVSHHINAHLVSTALEFVFKEDIHDILCKAGTDNSRTHAKHVSIVMSSRHFSREGV